MTDKPNKKGYEWSKTKNGYPFMPEIVRHEMEKAEIKLSEDFSQHVESIKFPSPRQTLALLSQYLKSKEIDREWNGTFNPYDSAGSKGGSRYLFYRDEKGTIKLDLWNGKIIEKDDTGKKVK